MEYDLINLALEMSVSSLKDGLVGIMKKCLRGVKLVVSM